VSTLGLLRVVCWGCCDNTLLCKTCLHAVYNQSRAVVHKVVDIDPHVSTGPSKGSINNHGVEWGSLNGQGVNE